MRLAIKFAIMAAGLGTAALAADDAKEASRIRTIAARYATCVIARSSTNARRFVLEQGRPPVDENCLAIANRGEGVQMTFPGQHYRYALAQALLVRDFPNGVPTDIAAAPVAQQDAPPPLDETKLPKNAKKATAIRDSFARHRSFWAMDRLGDCIARTKPVAAYALVQSGIDTPAERTAFEQLKPAIAECLDLDGTVRFAPGTLRGSVALNLYRLAYSVKKPANA